MKHLIAALALVVAAPAACRDFDPDDPHAEAGVQRSVWVQGLEHPWALAFLPDGRALVTERPGRLRLIRADGTLDPTPIAGLPPVLAHGQGGLMDVSLHPDFARNGLVYLTLSAGTPDANQTQLVRGRLDGTQLRNVTVLLSNAAKRGGQHFGSRLSWMADGTLLMSVGDGGNPPVRLGDDFIRKQAQNPAALFGKVLRLTADGKATGGSKAGDARVWTLGHRNIQGLVRDDRTGFIWATEHGARGGDELNLLKAGSNYGWPLVTHSKEYWGPEISKERSRPGMADPALVWQRAIAPSGLAVYRGQAFKGWDGNILAGGLLSQDVRRIVVNGQGVVTGQTRIGINARVRDVRVGPDGLIYVLTDEAAGRIIRLSPAG
ncbi:PQQ-dependent sugar dehydrogenase [Sandaracinobacteroides saxicola]|uniref:PQQ-dependent sugar dehydrogenase n=1 Tax=Sandaracinobacteroides saxicola TaxID=2759707 RepID=A0A7G5ILW3_9SPHN|nr:PQQ-dependent sugar dehydrogenase [Sandaracinobacteroides saxicola]QMW24355.1 PQQ-dependent sugar dehydrogenase [Sandaracinobacteroides saxicola]